MMVSEFCGVATRDAWLCVLRHAVARGRFKMERLWDLEVGEAWDGPIIYQGVMSKVELESLREDSTRLMEGLRCKVPECRSLFQREGEKHVVRTGAQGSERCVELGIGRV